MLWQASAAFWYRMPEGYAFTPGPEIDQVNPPPSFTRNLLWDIEAGKRNASLAPTEQAQVRQDLARWQVRSVIVGPMAHEDQAVEIFTEVLGRPPAFSGAVWLWTSV
jgi:hypothetical protein